MNIILIACLCSFVAVASVALMAIAIVMLDGTDFMDAIVERIRGKE